MVPISDTHGTKTRLEGRLPVVRDNALVGHIAAEFTREAAGSDPVPFYLNPRIGGVDHTQRILRLTGSMDGTCSSCPWSWGSSPGIGCTVGSRAGAVPVGAT